VSALCACLPARQEEQRGRDTRHLGRVFFLSFFPSLDEVALRGVGVTWLTNTFFDYNRRVTTPDDDALIRRAWQAAEARKQGNCESSLWRGQLDYDLAATPSVDL
ncbi:hypothetical protein CH063_13313, partial [Colletotrichum higginsianum]